MATRCMIGLYEPEQQLHEPESLLYVHWDGYPGDPYAETDRERAGMLHNLITTLTLFDKRRGCEDIEYCGAWLLWALMNKAVEEHKGSIYSQYEDGMFCTGFGLSKELHGDLSYYYAISTDKEHAFLIWVFEVGGSDWDTFKLIGVYGKKGRIEQIEKTYMNPETGAVDTLDGWYPHTPENAQLVEVQKARGVYFEVIK